MISVQYGGVLEFFDETVGYPLNYEIVPASGFYEGYGNWAKPDEKHLIERMRQVYLNRAEARQFGIKGSKSVAHLTWEKSNKKLLSLMHFVGMI